jgi:hypothetical protein
MLRILGAAGPYGSQSAHFTLGVIVPARSLGRHPPEREYIVETWTLIGDGLAAAPAGFRN